MARRLPAARGSATLDRALADLDVRLDAPLPADLAIGRGTAVFVSGTCFSPGARIASLALDVDGEEQPVMAHGMPRLETLRALGTPESYAQRVLGHRQDPGVRARGRTSCGCGRASRAAARPWPSSPRSPPARPPSRVDGPARRVAICMTTCNPPLELFRRQVDSIRAQTYDDWVCVVSDDCSDPERFAALQEVLGADPRFVVSRSPRRLGFYRNFERALELAPAGAAYVALADQDDRWHPDKLATLLAELGDAPLVYSDARVVTGDGRVLADTYWSRRDNNHTSLLSLLVANAVTGAASLFPAALLEDALPFPPAQFAHFHDHWLALVALSLGDIAFVERPLYDYVQHGEATLGHAAANRMPGMRERVGALRRDPHERVRMWRMHYYVDACRLLQFAAVLRLRCGDADAGRQAPRPRPLRARRPLARADRRARLARRAGAARAPPRHPRRRVDAVPRLRLAAPAGGERARPPDAPAAARRAAPADAGSAAGRAPARRAGGARRRGEDRAAAPRRARRRAPPRQPADPVDRPRALLRRLHRQVQPRAAARRARRAGPHRHRRPRRLAARVAGARTSRPTAGSRGCWTRSRSRSGASPRASRSRATDAFVATTWWTAHIAHAALRTLDARALPLPDPGVRAVHVPDGHATPRWRPSPTASRTPRCSPPSCCATTSAATALGVYAAGAEAGDRDSASFDNAITAIDPPSADELAGRHPRRLLFYARPEPHAARNMFELGVLGAQPGARARRVRGRLDPARHRDGPRRAPAGPRRRRAAGAAPALAPGRLRAAAARPRRRPRADVHARTRASRRWRWPRRGC